MGRTRDPSALKALRGTDRKDRRNDHEPEPDLLEDLTPPPHLSPSSAAVWAALAPGLRKAHILTVADVLQFEVLCDAVVGYRRARDEAGDKFVTYTSKGSQMVNQWLVAQMMFAKRIDSLGSKFGLDPVSRAKLMVDPQLGLFDKPGADQAGTGRFFVKH